eukprot:scaffold66388_cov52-Attheya_sp.AAC.1
MPATGTPLWYLVACGSNNTSFCYGDLRNTTSIMYRRPTSRYGILGNPGTDTETYSAERDQGIDIEYVYEQYIGNPTGTTCTR